MTVAAIDFVEWLAAWADRPPEFIQRVLWSALLVGLAFASIHLLTMLITRWGDHDSVTKSLAFSVLLHFSCGFGLVIVPPPNLSRELPEERKIPIRKLLVEGDEQVEREEKGNTPVWERLPEAPNQDLTHSDRSPLEFKPLEAPERRPEPLTPPDLEIFDAAPLPEESMVRPELFAHADEGFRTEAAKLLKTDETTAEARPDLQVPSRSMIRQQAPRDGVHEMAVQRQPTRGVVERLRPEFDPTQILTAIDAPSDPSAFLKRGNELSHMQRRSGPAPSPLTVDDAGTQSEAKTEGAESDSVGPPQFTRLRTWTPKDNPDGGMQRLRPERTPQISRSDPSRLLAVTDGVRTKFPTEGHKPQLVRPNFESIRVRGRSSVPATYRLRSLARRKEVARKYGGTEESEQSVEASLRWLALHQNAQGYWDPDGFGVHCSEQDQCDGPAGTVLHGSELRTNVERRAGLRADSGVTALTILAFLGAGYTHEEGQYAEQVDRALRWLVQQQQPDGFLGGEATHYARMYCHAMATYAVAEAYGMQSDPTSDTRLREPLARAVAYIVDRQNPDDGGWRYTEGLAGDMSMFGWQLMALKSAEIAGVQSPEAVKQGMIKFLKDRSLGESNGLAAYRLTVPRLPPTPSMTAEALFCKQILGISRTNPASVEAVEYLLENLPRRSELNLYYWYYGTLAMYQYGGQPWRDWNESLRDTLVADQRTTGHAAGSWDPTGPWGPHGGRIYATVVSTLCLEVYYRFLPLYQVGGQYADEP